MEYLCHKFDTLKGHISEIYTILTSDARKQGYMERWEADLNESLELDEWHLLAQNASRSLNNTSIIKNYKTTRCS